MGSLDAAGKVAWTLIRSSSGAEALGEPAAHEIEISGDKIRPISRSPRLRAFPGLLRPARHRDPQAVIGPGEDLDRDVTVPGDLQPTPDDR